MTKVYINGKLFDKSEAKISVYDHGLLYGDGVFEGIRVYSAKVFRLRQHIDRLYDSARSIHLEIPMSREQMTEAVLTTVKANKKHDGYIRLVITRGAGTLGIDPRKTTDPQVIIIVDDISMYPPELYQNGLEIITAATIRNHPAATNPRIRMIRHEHNRKLGGSLKTGFAAATKDLVLYMDADLPFDPDVLGRAMRAMEVTGADVIAGYRHDRTIEGLKRTIYSYCYNLLIGPFHHGAPGVALAWVLGEACEV